MKTYKMKLNILSLMDETPLGSYIKDVLSEMMNDEVSAEVTAARVELISLVFLQYYGIAINFVPGKRDGDWNIVELLSNEVLYRHTGKE